MQDLHERNALVARSSALDWTEETLPHVLQVVCLWCIRLCMLLAPCSLIVTSVPYCHSSSVRWFVDVDPTEI